MDIEDKTCQPSLAELRAYAQCALFDALCMHMDSTYRAFGSIEYSGDQALPGWNVKFKKSGKTLCTAYPRMGRFFVLLVVGRKEKPMVEALLPGLSPGFCEIYHGTQEGMGQRWLLFEFSMRNDAYDDVLRVVQIRRDSMKGA